jgi:hypothetical protein
MRLPVLHGVVFAIFSLSVPAVAQVNITLDTTAGGDFASLVGLNLSDLESELSTQISDVYAAAKPKKFLESLSNSATLSNRGIGVDYASNPDIFVVGIAGALAIDVDQDAFTEAGKQADLAIPGAAANLSLMVGFNATTIGPADLILYGNFFSKKDFKFGPKDRLRADLTNWGLHAQLKFFAPEGDLWELLFQWGGFDITTGVETSSFKVALTDSLTNRLPLAGGFEGEIVSTGSLSLDSSATTIPIEVSTNFRLLYLLSVYGGVGIDVQLGNSALEANLDGTITAKDVPDPSNPLGDPIDVDLGNATVTVDDEAGPSKGGARFFAGAQINVSLLRIFLQANLLPGGTYGVSFGGRIVW